ncbi:uncharacterized protein LOC103315182 [Tribolium castaneum]|uniref:MADF domain-containing protein n=1 Tax=Tribolium castaneum TaxID=7070 RepID=D6W8Y3_TRICA|nr:PREDICTED: uncharacterized protein LOC103315182 [Tribolium castaneum]EEZ98234.1 hypothetical protein TcasGA2_TC000673 [Tribolium castaneum]|eukprot:XP_008201435.1 PREDICTED: uncharacterized protein LOC103315182 [Tribolium castaneum]
MTESERIIELVRQHPILYNTHHQEYKNLKTKDKLWNELAESTGAYENGEELKKKWKNLRDSYSKHLRWENSEHKSKTLDKYKTWPWVKQMEFLRPFFPYVEPKEGKVSQDSVEETDVEEQKPRREKTSTPVPPPKKKKLETPDLNNSDNFPIFDVSGFDDIDLICLGFAKTIKKFSPKRRTLVKFRFSQILMQEELAQQEENEQSREEDPLVMSTPKIEKEY